MSSSFVYLIQAIGTGFYKIGFTKDVGERLKSLQTGSPHLLRLISSCKSANASLLERDLHKLMEPYRQTHEWFELPIEEVKRLMLVMSLPCEDEEKEEELTLREEIESIFSQAFVLPDDNTSKKQFYSQAEVAAQLGVTDRTVRTWLFHLRWIYYWKESELVQNGQFTREGILAAIRFQDASRSTALVINPKTNKVSVNRAGKSKTRRQTPRMSIDDYALMVWAENNVAPNQEGVSV